MVVKLIWVFVDNVFKFVYVYNSVDGGVDQLFQFIVIVYSIFCYVYKSRLGEDFFQVCGYCFKVVISNGEFFEVQFNGVRKIYLE